MAMREVVIFPAPVLHKKAKPVEKVDDEIRELLDDMAESMYAVEGVGLAAPQIGVSLRLAVIDVGEHVPGRMEGEDTLIKMVNPEILHQEGEIDFEEGCLSVPGFTQVMKRYSKVRVRFLDEKGEEQEIDGEGLLAVAFQQEIDHLDGKLIIDMVSPLKQDVYLQKRKKTEKEVAKAKRL
jgi:peptide deformylase